MKKRKHGLNRKRQSARTTRTQPTKPRRATAKSEWSKDIMDRVAHVISKMRSDGFSLRKASRETGIAPRTVVRRASSALKKNQSGRYIAKSRDRLIRTLKIPTPQGAQEIGVRGFRAASRLGRYWEAVHQYYATGDTSRLQSFRGKSITAVGGVKHPLLTDLDALNRLGSAGVLSFESLYSRSS